MKEISAEDAMKAYCGTWYFDVGGPEDKAVNNDDGTYGFYYPKVKFPAYSGNFEI